MNQEEKITNSHRLKVEGLDCADCAAKLERDLEALDGVQRAKVNFVHKSINIDFNPGKISLSTISKNIESLGFKMAATETQSIQLHIRGMGCSEEERTIRKALAGNDLVTDLQFDFVRERLKLSYSGDIKPIIKTIQNSGFTVSVIGSALPKEKSAAIGIWTIIISGLSAAIGIVLEYLGFAESATVPFLMTAIVIGGYRIAAKGMKAAFHHSLDMNFLMTIAVIGAIAIGEWGEGAMVMFLFSLSHLLERSSMERARNAITKLMGLTPKTAVVVDGEREILTSVERIKEGQVILMKPGEFIPLDGKIVGGGSVVNQAPITGESIPVNKEVGDEVYAGSINGSGVLRIQVSKMYTDSTISRIIHLVEEAQSRRAPIQLFVDKFARYYTPIVVVSAVSIGIIPPLFFGYAFMEWFYKALVLLVIACPCALVISTPVALVSGLATAARNGVLIKGGSFLERAASIDTVALDKTGTITYGRPRLLDIFPINGHSREEVLGIAASLEKNSEHHLARAVIEYADANGLGVKNVEHFSALPGAGVRGTIDGVKYFLANHSFFERMGICDQTIHHHLEKVENSRQTAVLLGTDDEVLGLLAVADGVREGAAEAIKSLRDSGINNIFIVSGDNHRTTQAVSEEIGGSSYFAELLPEHKLEIIRNRRSEGARIAMVGDGINDAPALAAADIGIAMGTAGTDIALETADVAIVSDDLRKLPYLIRLSKRTLGIIRQNIFFAIGIKAVFVIMNFLGMATLWMAVFADMGASLLVISNSLRILRAKID